MKNRNFRIVLAARVLTVVLFAVGVTSAQTTAFSFQGSLTNGGAPANGNFDMEFKLFDAAADGSQVGSTFTDASVTVINGIFSAVLDFGAEPFDPGTERYVEIAVRPAGSTTPHTVLTPRQRVASAPFAIKAKRSDVAEVANNALQLGGIDASEYVTTSSVGNAFIRNSSVMQSANFAIAGDGIVGGSLSAGAFPSPGYKLTVSGSSRFFTGNGEIVMATPAAETGISMVWNGRADIRFNGGRMGLFAGSGAGVPTNGLTIDTSGNVASTGSFGVGTATPQTRLTVAGGPQWTSNLWTASVNLASGAALGWDANASGTRFGIGQSTGGLYFFRTASPFGSTATPANYSLAITDAGNTVQARENNGLVKAMLYVNANGTVIRCYNGIAHLTAGNCGFVVNRFTAGRYGIDFGFQVSDRFISITPRSGSGLNSVNIGTGFYFPVGSPNEVDVDTFITDVDYNNSHADHPFMIIVY